MLGDESGYELGEVQKVKLAAIEAEWHTETPPAAFTIFGFPSNERMETSFAIKIPWMMGIIATRSLSKEVKGIHEIIADHETRIRSGAIAYENLVKLRGGDTSDATKAAFNTHKEDLGYGLLLKRYVEHPTQATEEQIKQAARDSIPSVPYLFWSFRIMVAIGFALLGLFLLSFYYLSTHTIERQTWLLKTLVWSIPLP